MKPLVIGSRSSRLALWQAGWVAARLQEAGVAARIEMIRTSGDRLGDRPLAVIGGKGVFVKEIEEALLGGTIDLAVHSLKDLPTAQPDGLVIACVPAREDPRDILIAPGRPALADLPTGAVIGTGSPRRACQIRSQRPDLQVKDLRGNVDTRLAQLREGAYDAIVLALAGVRRIGAEVEGTILEFDRMIPAVGQGAMAIETRSADRGTVEMLRAFHHEQTATAVSAERAFLRALGGGCQAPIAAVAEIAGDRLTLTGLVGDVEGESLLRHRGEGPAGEPEAIGRGVAEELLRRGASELVGRGAAAPPEGP